MKKYLKKGTVLWAFLLVAAVTLVLFFYPPLPVSWKTLSPQNVYSINYPTGWSYANVSEGKLVIISDFKGQLSIQDRSSPKENTRLTITKIAKKTIPTLEEAENKYNSSYSTSAMQRFITKIGEDTTVKLIIDNSILQKNTFYSHMVVLLVDHGDSIYQIEGGVYPDVGFLKTKSGLKILNGMIDSFGFL